LPVKRKPIINYLVDLFLQEGIGDIFVLISKDFREEFDWWKKRYYPKNKIQFIEESKPLGTFGGLWYLKKELSQSPFFLTNGDELKKLNLQKMIEFHQKAPGIATIALVKVPNPQDYGVVLTQSNLVSQFLEKPENPPSRYISSGLYLLSPEVFKYHPGPNFSMIETDLFPKLAKEKKLAGFKFQGKWIDCGTWERYEKALRYWK
jgi:NDP-sugar pyrophosphorylase family protein